MNRDTDGQRAFAVGTFISVLLHERIEGCEEMDVLSALVVSALLIGPASGGNLLEKDVWTMHVDMEWTEISPGIEALMDGVLHSTALIFSTRNPMTFRFVGLSTFHGTIGMRGYDPIIGSFLFLEEDKVNQIREVVTFTFNETDVAIAVDGLLSLRLVSSMTIIIGDFVLLAELNFFLMIKISDGELEWAKLGVPMGLTLRPSVLSDQVQRGLS